MDVPWTLHTGSCLDPQSGLASLPDKSVDHFITDPPFSDVTHDGARGGNGSSKLVTFDSIDEAGLAVAFEQFGRIARRWVVTSIDWHHVLFLEQNAFRWGLRFVRFGIWIKPNGAPQFTGDRPAQGWEAIAILHAESAGRMRWNGGGRHGVWTVPKVNGSHPTQKPLDLLQALVRDFTDPGDLICDPFVGSGTTGVAAVHLGRRFVGWELDPKHAATARGRLEGTREQISLFAGLDGAA